jgi:hypothetical protein
MIEDLDMLGAEGLSSQYITLRVKSIDKAKLGQALGGGTKATALPAALAVVDFAPRQALDLAMPYVLRMAKDDYGVELEYQITENAPTPAAMPKSDMGKGMAVGAALGIAGLWAASRFGLIDVVRGILHRIF